MSAILNLSLMYSTLTVITCGWFIGHANLCCNSWDVSRMNYVVSWHQNSFIILYILHAYSCMLMCTPVFLSGYFNLEYQKSLFFVFLNEKFGWVFLGKSEFLYPWHYVVWPYRSLFYYILTSVFLCPCFCGTTFIL